MKKLLLILVLLCFIFPAKIYAQCSSGKTEIVISVTQDQYGSEITWTLSNSSGNTIVSGGPYSDLSGSGTTTHVLDTCVFLGEELTFTIKDSYGDGFCAGYGDGFYTVELFDFVFVQGCNIGKEESTTFTVISPPDENAALENLDIPLFITAGDVVISGEFSNKGVNTITSIDLNWSVNDGIVNTQNVTGIIVASQATYDFTHNVLWNATDLLSTNDLKVWLSNPNEIADEIPENDTISLKVFILDESSERKVLIEHHTQASCGPCAQLNPGLDALINTGDNPSKVVHIGYHTSWPGTDPMYDFNNLNGLGNARVAYYGVGGVPNVVVAGNQAQGSPSIVTQEIIDAEYARPGLFNINIDPIFANDSIITVELDITSLANFNVGSLKAHVVLVQDMEYSSAPGTNGEKSFPDVMRYMISGLEGVDIGLPKYGDVFTTILSQKIDTVIVKDYEFVVFIQDDETKEVHMVSAVSPDIKSPFASMSPFNGEKDVVLDQELSITFKEQVRFIDGSELIDPTALITFKKNDALGADVDFLASINTEKTKITITPNNYMEVDEHYYVALSNSLEDNNNVAIGAHNSTFKTMSPTSVEFSIDDSAINIITNSILLTFSEPVRLINDDPITSPESLITLKENNQSGSNVSFTATINDEKTVITVSPSTYFDQQQNIFIRLGGTVVENKYDVVVAEASLSFTTGVYPTVTTIIAPANEATDVVHDVNITISFDAAVRLINDDPVTDPTSLVTLKKTDSNGEDILFSASINDDKTIITIDPNDNLELEQIYFVNIGATVENSYNMAIEDTSITFTTEATTYIYSNFQSKDFEIYPNPFKDKLNISFDCEQVTIVIIEVYNQSGMLVKSIKKNAILGDQQIEINTEDLSNGIYFLKLNFNNNSTSKKIVLLR